MKTLMQLCRLLKIQWIFARYGLDKLLFTLPLLSPWRFLVYLNPYHWLPRQVLPRGEAARRALEDLGPIFVKFGQVLSTRCDLLPEDITQELAQLQDNVPPFPSSIAHAIVARELGQPIDQLFAEFSLQPLASASIAQVHTARLFSGEQVIVKILRPNIDQKIKRDLVLMKSIARLLERYWSESKRLHPIDVVAEFEKNIIDELDFMREAANASQLKRNFTGSPLLYVPEIYWDKCCEKVMVQERVYGVPIAQYAELKKQGVNIKLLAERGVEIFFTQVFRDSFFHADMHPGNIFVDIKNPQQPRYVAIDFGIMGALSNFDQRYLAENLLAFFNRDYRLVAQLHVESGWVPRNTSVSDFESAIRTVCEPIFERPLKDISFAMVLMRLFQTSRRFNMEVQPQLVLLQKTLLAVEGLGRQLYPDLDLWHTAKPFLEKWVSERVGIKSFINKSWRNMPFWLEKMPDLPLLIYDILEQTKQQKLVQSTQRKLIQQRPPQGYAWSTLCVGILLGAVAVSLLFKSLL